MKFSFFHLIPYTHLELESHDWPFPNRYFDPAKASALYRTYVESMIHAEACGFDWVGCNEHHFSPYGMMANCNLIGGALRSPNEPDGPGCSCPKCEQAWNRNQILKRVAQRAQVGGGLRRVGPG